MPADLSKPASSSRRKQPKKDVDEDSFDSSHMREIELKRSRGEISCAECRRLKIRCDKTIPCKSCQRRGCAALCPNGSLATGQGTRFVLAATEHLHKRLAKMKERIRQLEDALAILQAKSSNETHPLLRDDLIIATTDQDEEDMSTDNVIENPPDVIDAFGTLSVSERGVSRFFGPTGGVEYLLFNSESISSPGSPSADGGSLSSARESMTPPIQGELIRFSASFPFTPIGPTEEVHRMVESYLPPYERAVHLGASYLEGAAWLFRGLTRQQLMEEMIPALYRRGDTRDSTCLEHEYTGPHDLALVFLAFAVGALVDDNPESQHTEAEHYHHLARAALCLQPILEKPSLVTIQALRLLSIYTAMAGNERESSIETSWSLVTLSAQLAQSIGLHRDSARWGLTEQLVNRRRILFWDLFLGDVWQSLATGRPPSFARDYVDCKFPGASHTGDNSETDESGEYYSEFETWQCKFSLQCVSEVAVRALAAEPPSYSTIMELDRKVREFHVPPEVTAFVEEIKVPAGEAEVIPLHKSFERYVMSNCREVVLLWIHRSFFAQAIIDCPSNPLRSNYAHSFLAAYRASVTILTTIKNQYVLHPCVTARIWLIWTYAFSAAVVFGTVVTRGPLSPLAGSAIQQLDLACDLFSKASKLSKRAARALPILIKLSEKAHAALAAARNDPARQGAQWTIKVENEADELDIFAGKTRLVAEHAIKQRMSNSPDTNHLPEQPSPQGNTSPLFDTNTQPVLHPPPTIPSLPSLMTETPIPGTTSWVDPNPHLRPQVYPYQTYTTHPSENFYPMSSYDSLPQPSPVGYGWPQPGPMQSSPTHSLPPPSYPPTPASHPMHTQPQYPAEFHHHHHHHHHSPPSSGLPQSYMRQQPGPQDGYVPPPELVNLGLASRDSRLGDKWTEFMQQSGFLDDVNLR